jgi:atypical dual specificity phosphatase
MPNILSLRSYSIGFANRRILTNIDLDIEDTGVTHVLGACGSGKSTLFRSLAGLNEKSNQFRCSGSAIYLGEQLGKREHPALLEQIPASLVLNVADSIVGSIPDRASLTQKQQRSLVFRLFDLYDCNHLLSELSTPLTKLGLADRRIVLILGLVTTAPALLMLDEPTADIPADEARSILRIIGTIAEQRAVMLVQHNQALAKELNGNAILLAGGRIQEEGATKELLSNPQSTAGREFMATGTCAAPDPDCDPSNLDEVYINRYQPKVRKKSKLPKKSPFGPRGFRWVAKNSLAATPRPGLLADQAFDLEALAKVGVNFLLSLEEQETVSRTLASEFGIEVYHFPIQDMQAPELDAVEKLTALIDRKIKSGNCLAVHCKAGLGRTGTVIASYFVKSGMTPLEATRKIRCVDPRMIQSEQQENFITEFHNWLQDHHLEYHEICT